MNKKAKTNRERLDELEREIDELDSDVKNYREQLAELENDIEYCEGEAIKKRDIFEEMERVLAGKLDEPVNPADWLTDEEWLERAKKWAESVKKTKEKDNG